LKVVKKEIKEVVKDGYAKIAKQKCSCYVPVNPCCGGAGLAEFISEKTGYTEEELESVPEGANLGLGCGNPVALASLQEGETVIDLGSGAGFDCFLAAQRVGEKGKVIGVDMTPEMIERARENARKGNYRNIDFRLGEIENLPITDNSADIIISNCVINLSPEKERVFQEAFRVLRPGGRMMVSDIVLLKELPNFIKNSVEGYIGCLSGAIMKEEYLGFIKAAGFQEVTILEETLFPIEYMENDPTAKAVIGDLKISPEKVSEIEHSVLSIKVYAVKLTDNMKVKVGKHGELRLPEKQRKQWGLEPGKEFQVRETRQGLLLWPLDPPLTKVYVEPTTTCNLSCRTCMRNSWNEPIGSMEMSVYRRLIDGLKEITSLRTMAFWGLGEPLLHPDIVEMVVLAKKLGVRVEIITNGLLLNREIAEKLVLAGLDTIVVSIDGCSPKSYAEIRSGSDFRTVQENVKGLVAVRSAHRRDNPEIGLEFVAMRHNVSELQNLRYLARSLGATFVVVTNVLPYVDELKDQILYWQSGSKFYPRIRSCWFPDITLPPMDGRGDDLQPLLSLLQQIGTIDPLMRCNDAAEVFCRFVREGAAAVAWDGELSPCVALMHSYTCYVLGKKKNIKRYTVGNVGQEKIAKIWESNEYRQFRKRVVEFDFSPCVNCSGCELSESNEEDCFGNKFPVCGDCLWAQGVILCP
jgi:MoaA/NifB/PqqE/SkfB family radical SAM enzyme/ubiquinone/menaquinone biosynthesis C-methylase UbiE